MKNIAPPVTRLTQIQKIYVQLPKKLTELSV